MACLPKMVLENTMPSIPWTSLGKTMLHIGSKNTVPLASPKMFALANVSQMQDGHIPKDMLYVEFAAVSRPAG